MINKLKQNKLILIIFIISVILIITGVTYSLYNILFVGKKEQVIDAGGIVFKYNETSDGLILDNNSILDDTAGKSQEKYFDFEISLTSNKNTSINYIIAIDENDISTLTNDKVKVYLTNQDNIEIVSPISISQLEVDVNKNNYKKLYNKQINQGEKHLYRLRTWIDDTKDLYTETSNDGNHTLEMKDVIYKFKVNVYTVLENEETITTGVDTLIALTDNKDSSGLYTITHPKDSTLQIGNDKDITEYRYRGANPKNYVTFNNEVWRILGVFPTDDGTGNIENRIKLIRDQSIGSYAWNSNDEKPSNAWVRRYNTGNDATLNVYLNNTYINTLTNNSKNMISDVKYYLGGHGSGNYKNAQEMYSYERKISGDNFYTNGFKTNWLGKIALMYASDYGYASSNCETNIFVETASDGFPPATSTKDIRVCNDTNWLYNIKVNEWLLDHSPRSDDSTYSIYLFYIAGQGYIDCRYSTYAWSKLNVRPTLYLKSDVKITGGDGTSTNPYTLGL